MVRSNPDADSVDLVSLDKMAEIRDAVLHYAALTICDDGSQEDSDQLAKSLASIIMLSGQLIEERQARVATREHFKHY